MKLHFFTVNEIDEYRKHYRHDAAVKDIYNAAHPQTLEELDQAYFYRKAKGPDDETFESEIYWETGIAGLKLDFNYGLRLDVPEGNFRVRISDFDTEKICLDKYISGGRIISVEKYFIRWHVEIFLDEEKIFDYTLDLAGKPVAVKFISDALGDTLSMIPYVSEFKKIHGCAVALRVKDYLRALIARLYPDLPPLDEKIQPFATYYPMMYQSSPFVPLVPADVREMSLLRIGGMLLGINHLPPKAPFKPTESPVTDEPYVCIGIQARNARKGWLYPHGWDIVVDYLKSLGYRVFCIDKNAKETGDELTVCKPEGAEDFTGDRPLLERANMLYHAEFFIGIGSGLSWLADAVNCPVVMICGFSQDWCEFYTPYRVMNYKACHGCFNDMRVSFLGQRCPYHKGTPREMECQKTITPRMVIDAIERLIVDKNLIPPALSIRS
ncbi:MAG: autotransporter strand-loop-strand O-heptosyltransferase [Selenomonadaceae bacterium]|nr:autotransporter strand-loop-strand O-heptosyltransferase [Selenomonadaceae bacterium]